MAVFTAISAWATSVLGPGALSIFGLSPTVTAAIFSAGRAALWSLAGQALSSQSAPRQKTMANISQTDSARMKAYGRNLMGGIRAFYESDDGRLFQIIVLAHGRSDGLINFWMDGEVVSIDSEGYKDRYTQFLFRDGSAAGGDYQEVLDRFPTIWTPNHRLQNQTTIMVKFGDPADEKFQQFYPKGPNSLLQGEIRGSLVWDLSGGRIYSENAGLVLHEFFRSPDGWNMATDDMDIPSWRAFRDLSEEQVNTLSGPQRRYGLAGFYSLDDALKDITTRMLATCDGQIYETAEGKVAILGGEWTEPDFTLTSSDIFSVEMNDGFDPLKDYNILQGNFVSPDHSYQPTAVPEYKDEALLEDQEERFDQYDNHMSPASSQTQRLMKIKYAKDHRLQQGTLTTNLVGIKARFPQGRGIHAIRINAPELNLVGVYEVTSHSFSVAEKKCTIGIASLENPYGWSLAEEQPLAPAVAEIGLPDHAQTPPEVLAFYQEVVDVSGNVKGVKLIVEVVDPDRESLQLQAQITRGDFEAVGPWPTPGPTWVEMPADDYRAESGILDDGATYTVRICWRKQGNWVKAGTMTVSANPNQPDPPLGLSSTVTGMNAYLEWTNAVAGYYRTRVYIGTTNNFNAASLVATVSGNAGRPDNHLYISPAAGLRYAWVATVNASGVQSTPTGPINLVFS